MVQIPNVLPMQHMATFCCFVKSFTEKTVQIYRLNNSS